jgi:hypothetical protein
MRVERPRLDCRAAILAETNSLSITVSYTILSIQAFAIAKAAQLAGAFFAALAARNTQPKVANLQRR